MVELKEMFKSMGLIHPLGTMNVLKGFLFNLISN